jgi:hypothetical protein
MSVNIDAGGNAVFVSARKVKFHVPTVPTVLGKPRWPASIPGESLVALN